jgi:hypothetical protein
VESNPGCIGLTPAFGYVALQSHRGADVFLRNIAIVHHGTSTQTIEQFSNPEFRVFPNPAEGEFRVSLDDFRCYELYNSLGVMVLNDSSTLVNTGRLDAGVYLLRAYTGVGIPRNIKVILR